MFHFVVQGVEDSISLFWRIDHSGTSNEMRPDDRSMTQCVLVTTEVNCGLLCSITFGLAVLRYGTRMLVALHYF